MGVVQISLLISTILFLICLSSVLCNEANVSDHVGKDYAILMPLDHFNEDNNETFNMRYYIRRDFWKYGGPAYIYIGDEYSVDKLKGYLTAGLVADLANETHGVIYLIEHRYYGKTQILEDQEETRYEFLSVKQVLADLAYFIKKIKEMSSMADSKVVAVGGSYGGRLATWMRLKYPELVDAAVASSAPLKNALEFPEYYSQVADIYEEYGGYSCLRAVQNKIRHERDLLHRESGEDDFKMEENFCNEVEIHGKSQKNMYGSLILNHIAKPAVHFDVGIILKNCEEILSHIHESKSDGCYFFNFNITGWSETPYDYLRCTELAQFPTSTDDSGLPYDIPLKMYTDRCTEVYGAQHDGEYIKDAMRRMDEEYGGVTPNVTKVVFVNGGLDPWHHLGVLEDLSEDAPALFIRNGKHCQDLLPQKLTDSHDLKETRTRIKELIKDWTGNHEHISTSGWSFFKPSRTWDLVAK